MKYIEGLDGLQELIRNYGHMEDHVRRLDNQTVDLKNSSTFVPNHMVPGRLLQDTANQSADEQAKFIQENPELDHWLQGLRHEINQKLKGN